MVPTQCGKAFQSGTYAIDARRLHLLMKWVVSFSILSRFGHHRRGASERESAWSRRRRRGGREGTPQHRNSARNAGRARL